VAERLPDNLTNYCLPYQTGDILEMDEMWTYVSKKIHAFWIWLVINRRTRQVIAYHLGSRETKDCQELWNKVPKEYKQAISYSDFWHTYQVVINTDKDSSKHKHQQVGKETGETNHVERLNNTFRQRISRLVRKTLSYSKSDYYLECHLRLFIHNYNNSVISVK
jgi:IS1 family transposase